MKFRSILGILITSTWIICFVTLTYFKFEEAKLLSLDEWGDFLAGAAAPIALLWVVLGYLQQGEELRLNTEALRAQQHELKLQVEKTTELSASAERQAIAAEELASISRSQNSPTAQIRRMLFEKNNP